MNSKYKRYRRRSYEAYAIEWTGENTNDVKEFLKDIPVVNVIEHNEIPGVTLHYLEIKMPFKVRYVSPGEMILLGPENDINVVLRGPFDRLYEEIPS